MVKLLFTFIPLKVRFNYGVSLLSANCTEAGIWNTIVPVNNTELFLYKSARIAPTYICFSFTTSHEYYMAIPLLKELQSRGMKVICGGTYLRSGGWVNPTYFHHVFRDDGEQFANVMGFSLRHDVLPEYGYYNLQDMHRDNEALKGLSIIPISTSYGCQYGCSFCETQYLRNSSWVRLNVTETLDKLFQKHAPDLFFFLDELIPVQKHEWREQMKGNKHPFFAYIRGDIRTEHLNFLIDNGLYACAFGVESGHEEYRNSILNKQLTDEAIYRTLQHLKSRGIKVATFFMTNTPYEKDVHKKATRYMMEMMRLYDAQTVLWEYEHLKGKRFEINPRHMKVYARGLDVTPEKIYKSLDNPKLNVVSYPEAGFFIYEKMDKFMYIHELFSVDRDVIYPAIEETCRMLNCTSYGGHTKTSQRAAAFNETFGTQTTSYMISKEVM